jgi:hypothetical protein
VHGAAGAGINVDADGLAMIEVTECEAQTVSVSGADGTEIWELTGAGAGSVIGTIAEPDEDPWRGTVVHPAPAHGSSCTGTTCPSTTGSVTDTETHDTGTDRVAAAGESGSS